MKRLLALAAVCALALAFIGASRAQTVAAHLTCKDIRWRTQQLASGSTDPTFKVTGGTAGYVDSATFSRIGRGSTTAGSDTSVALSLIGMASFMGGSNGATPTLDSMQYVGRLILEDAGTTGTIDSVYVIPQVSYNGSQWFSLGGQGVGKGNLGQGTPGYGVASLGSDAVAVNAKIFSFPMTTGSTFGTGRGTIEMANWRGFPLIRFIVQNDGSSATVIHNFRGTFCYYTAVATTNTP